MKTSGLLGMVSIFLLYWHVDCNMDKSSPPLQSATEIQSLNDIMNRFTQYSCGVTKP